MPAMTEQAAASDNSPVLSLGQISEQIAQVDHRRAAALTRQGRQATKRLQRGQAIDRSLVKMSKTLEEGLVQLPSVKKLLPSWI